MTKKMVPNVKGLLFVFLIAAIFTIGLTPMLGATTLVPYDPLTTGPIDSAKWDSHELIRVIDPDVHMLKLGVRSGTGSINPTTSSISIPSPNSVTKISAKIVPIQFSTSNIAGGAYAKAMAMVGARFYNDGTAGGEAGSCLGDVLAQVGIGNTSGSGAEPRIYWSVVRYTSADCNATEVLESGVLTDTVITGTATIEWDGSTTITFTYDNGTTYTDTFTISTPRNSPNTIYKGMHTKIKDNEGLDATVLAYFDDVNLSDVLYDDFLADQINDTKWTSHEAVRKIDDVAQHLVLLARSTTKSNKYTENNLAIAVPESVGAIQATVTAAELDITNTATANSFVYVGGRFFNDGTGSLLGAKAYQGDIAAFVKLQVTSDGQAYIGKWKVTRCTGDTADEMETLAEGVSPKPILLGKPYKLSVAWDGTKFTLVGNNKTVNYTPPITVTANATVAKMPYKGLGAVINEPAVDGTAVGYFTDVMTGPGPEFITVDISGTGSVKSGPAGILCGNGGTACSKAFPLEKKVTLTAKAGTGWVFQKWEGAGAGECTTKTSCRVTVNAAKSVQADFMKFPTLLLSPKSKNYGNVQAVSKIRTAVFTIMNKTTKGVTPLNINGALSLAITQGVPGEFVIQDDLCSNTTLQPKGKCTFKVVFQPASTGAKAANVTFPCDDPSPPTLQLIGNGVQ